MITAFDVLGSVFAVDTNNQQLCELVDAMFATFPKRRSDDADVTLRAVERPDRDCYFDVWAETDGEVRKTIENKHFDRVVMGIAVHINSEALFFADMHTVHAGVVALDGRALAFPASSGSGKSTLAAACAAIGMDYVSDEALCLDWATGDVVPYAKPLWLSRWSRHALGMSAASLVFESPRYEESIVTPLRMGWQTATERTRLAHVVSISRDGRQGLEPGSSSHTADELIRHAFYKDRPRESFELAANQARQSQYWNLVMGDPTQSAEALLRVLSTGELG